MKRFLIGLYCFLIIIIHGFAQKNIPENNESSSLKPFSNSQFIFVDSVKFHYRIWKNQLAAPKGKVLLVHGFIGSTFCWRENIDPLTNQGYEVVAVDLPGFGYSDRNLHVNQSQSNRARILWDFLTAIDKNDSSRWNIVGHSMGGGTAEAMSLMKPERIQSLTIVDGMVFIRNKNLTGSFVLMTRMKEYNKVLVAITKKKMIDFDKLQKIVKKLYGYTPDSAVVKGYLKPLQMEGSAECILNIFANAREIQHLHSDSLSVLPILVIWGKEDRTIRLRSAKKFKRSVPTIDLKIIPGARHSPMETHSAIFNGYLLEFLNKNN